MLQHLYGKYIHMRSEFESLYGQEFHISTHLPIPWVSGALSPGIKWLGREADHVKETFIYASTSP
jgi:hypothetical protein